MMALIVGLEVVGLVDFHEEPDFGPRRVLGPIDLHGEFGSQRVDDIFFCGSRPTLWDPVSQKKYKLPLAVGLTLFRSGRPRLFLDVTIVLLPV